MNIVTAKEEHTCYVCGKPIKIGTKYVRDHRYTRKEKVGFPVSQLMSKTHYGKAHISCLQKRTR